MTTIVTPDKSFTPRLLVESTAKFHINAPTSDIDITEWVFTCGDQEYIDCTPESGSHMSAGFTTSPEGGRMSLNVEYIGGALICEHYHERIGEKLHCRLESVSDTIFGNIFTTTHVIWELIATPIAGNHHEFTNNVWVRTTEKFDQYLDLLRIPYETARCNYQAAVAAHNHEETPGFAKAIERRALGRNR
jgi:frataxin-like iron-binding protein CyaY